MKALYLLFPIAALLSSCSVLDPNYAQYRQQQQTQAGQTAVQGSNPYGVPGQTPQVGQYQEVNLPYQDIPAAPPSAPTYTPTPTPTYSPAPTSSAASHTVSPGDSLWAISRKYGKTVEAIQAANGLSSTTIRTGQTLNIPQ